MTKSAESSIDKAHIFLLRHFLSNEAQIEVDKMME